MYSIDVGSYSSLFWHYSIIVNNGVRLVTSMFVDVTSNKNITHMTSYKLVFNAFKKNQRNDDFPLHIKIIRNRKSYFIPTGFNIESKYWNKRLHCIKNEHPQWMLITESIQRMIEQLRQVEIKNNASRLETRMEDFKAAIQIQSKRESLSFTEFFKNEIEQLTDITEGTRQIYRNTLEKLKNFRKEIAFSDLNLTFLQDFERYLQSIDLSPNTRAKHHTKLRHIINQSIHKDIFAENRNPYRKGFKLPKEETFPVFLTWNEVEKIEQLQFLEPEIKFLDFYRDIFLFMCYTGLRISDVLGLKREHLQIEGNKMFLIKRMYKTSTFLKNIPYHKHYEGKAVTIIQKYLVNEIGNIFPSISDKQVRVSVKKIADFAGIKKDIHPHAARHTFITDMFRRKQSIIEIQQFTGHSKIDTLMKYAHYIEED